MIILIFLLKMFFRLSEIYFLEAFGYNAFQIFINLRKIS